MVMDEATCRWRSPVLPLSHWILDVNELGSRGDGWVCRVLTCELIVLRTKGISLLIPERLALCVCQPLLPESQPGRQKQPKDSGLFLLFLETEGVCFVSYLCFKAIFNSFICLCVKGQLAGALSFHCCFLRVELSSLNLAVGPFILPVSFCWSCCLCFLKKLII